MFFGAIIGLTALASVIWGGVAVREAGNAAEKAGTASKRMFPSIAVLAGLAGVAWWAWGKR